jgi:hypothetical protein
MKKNIYSLWYLLGILGCALLLSSCASLLRESEAPPIIEHDVFDVSVPLPGVPENVEVNPATGKIYVVYRAYPALTYLKHKLSRYSPQFPYHNARIVSVLIM